MTIGVAIIGSGIFVREEHLPAVQANSNLSLKAVYSRSLKSATALNSNVDLYSEDSGAGKSYQDLLARSDIQAVIIALPIPSQPQFIKLALKAGKHVLSEKPIAKDIASAKELIKFYEDEIKGKGATWGVAENFRFLDSFEYARQEVAKLGRVLGFRVKMFGNVKAGGKYFETPWRKTPEYQGGFLLDGGVHFVAGTRLLLGEAAKPVSLTAYTTLLQEHLPPVDTVNSVWKTASGVSGTFQVSFGTTLSGSEYTVACEKGSVTIARSTVTVRIGEESEGTSEDKEFNEEGSGVKQEVKAWTESIVKGKADVRQAPAAALADLEILEKMLTSGEEDGAPKKLELQV